MENINDGQMQKLNKGNKKVFRRIILSVIIVLLVAAILVSALLQTLTVTYIVVGDSMLPNLHDGQKILCNKSVGKIKVGDIVVVNRPDNKVIKRVAAVEGDSVVTNDGKLYINDNYISPTDGSDNTLVIESGYVFVLGDNHSVSLDSREYGAIPITLIDSKMMWSGN